MLSNKTFQMLRIVMSTLLFSLLTVAIYALINPKVEAVMPYLALGLGLPILPIIIIIALESTARVTNEESKEVKQ